MLKKGLGIFGILFLLISLSGCATARRQKDLQVQALRNQVSVLEVQLQSKNEEINNLKEALDKAMQEKEALPGRQLKKKLIPEAKSRPNIKQIQAALKNAGYNPGPIDGKMGKQTKDAIKTFQRANNLLTDGKVGKDTWGLLRKYLYQKVK